MWAHAEYLKLLRSAKDGAVFDRLDVVAARYLNGKGRRDLEVWKFSRQISAVAPGSTLRVQGGAPFSLHWSLDAWGSPKDTPSTATALGLFYVDIAVPKAQRAPLRFTFFWPVGRRWEGRDFTVDVK